MINMHLGPSAEDAEAPRLYYISWRIKWGLILPTVPLPIMSQGLLGHGNIDKEEKHHLVLWESVTCMHKYLGANDLDH